MVILGAVLFALGYSKGEAYDQTKGMWLLLAGAATALLGVLITNDGLGIPGMITEGEGFAPATLALPGNDGGLWAQITLHIARWIPQVGIVGMLWGTFQFFEAFRNDDAAQKIKGLKFLFAGALLWQIVHLMTAVLTP
jgi:hypothetical protein